jgi:hypothetical protein
MIEQHISIGVFVVYIDTGSSALSIPSKSRDLVDENNKIWTEWKWFEKTVLKNVERGKTNTSNMPPQSSPVIPFITSQNG